MQRRRKQSNWEILTEREADGNCWSVWPNGFLDELAQEGADGMGGLGGKCTWREYMSFEVAFAQAKPGLSALRPGVCIKYWLCKTRGRASVELWVSDGDFFPWSDHLSLSLYLQNANNLVAFVILVAKKQLFWNRCCPWYWGSNSATTGNEAVAIRSGQMYSLGSKFLLMWAVWASACTTDLIQKVLASNYGKIKQAHCNTMALPPDPPALRGGGNEFAMYKTCLNHPLFLITSIKWKKRAVMRLLGKIGLQITSFVLQASKAQHAANYLCLRKPWIHTGICRFSYKHTAFNVHL